MNYDSMSVHELVELLVSIGSQDMRRVEIEEAPAIESALRRAAIREASVQTLHIEVVETGHNTYGVWEECEVNGVAQARDSILRILPAGDYAIVSTETP